MMNLENPVILLGYLAVLVCGCNSPVSVTPDRFIINDPNLAMELVAASPDVQTPIGLAIDDQDQLYVLESHTHTPPEDYRGPDYDLIKKGVDRDGDGRPDHWLTYADSLEDGMNLVFGPNQELYVTTKNAVWAYNDFDDDGISDEQKLVLQMAEPESVYDHAGILGLAVSPDNQWLFVSRGNTGGEHWEITGTDGSSISGYGDGGNVMRCRLDGSELEEVATGFWNPFDIKFTLDGRLLLTDNDPDSRGPNRLIEVVPGGDYGYQSLYGGSGLHPFVAWNGELPGTLPYAAALGEAPCALLDGGTTALGQSYYNSVLVNVWEEKNMVKIPLKTRGWSVEGVPEVVVQGDSTFHPVALAVNTKGDVYITNWVMRQYPNHGRGEIWRISNKTASTTSPRQTLDNFRFKTKNKTQQEVIQGLASGDPFLQSISRWELQQSGDYQPALALLKSENPELRLQGLLVWCKSPDKLSNGQLESLLNDQDVRIRKAALYYIGSRQLQGAEEILNNSLKNGKIDHQTFEGYLAAMQNLHPEFVAGFRSRELKKSSDLERKLPPGFIEEIIGNNKIAESIRALAFPYLGQPEEKVDLLLDQLQQARNESYQVSLIDAVRNLPHNPRVDGALLVIGKNRDNASRVRSGAIAALQGLGEESCEELLKLLPTTDSLLQYATVKKLCGCVDERDKVNQWIDANRKVSTASVTVAAWEKCQSGNSPDLSDDEWISAVNGEGNTLRGELVFKSQSSQCLSCHRVNGWGGQYGPDLSGIGSSKNRQQLINAIIFPSMEMAPEWQGWYVIDRDGNRYLGRQIDVHLNRVELMNLTGAFDSYAQPLSYGVAEKSVMPEGLQNTMSRHEFNDLIAYLMSLGQQEQECGAYR